VHLFWEKIEVIKLPAVFLRVCYILDMKLPVLEWWSLGLGPEEGAEVVVLSMIFRVFAECLERIRIIPFIYYIKSFSNVNV
jgi:hypothetical protein